MKRVFSLFVLAILFSVQAFASDLDVERLQNKLAPDFGVSSDIKYASISGATSGDNTVVAAVSGKRIRVLSVALITTTATTVAFESGASGTALTGDMPLAANGGFVLPFNAAGWFQTASGSLLNMELGGAIQTSGMLTYIEV